MIEEVVFFQTDNLHILADEINKWLKNTKDKVEAISINTSHQVIKYGIQDTFHYCTQVHYRLK